MTKPSTNPPRDNIVIVSGANGTGKTLIHAIINARPDIFLMYEARPYRTQLGGRTLEFVERFPEIQLCYKEKRAGKALRRIKSVFTDTSDLALQSYSCIREAIEARGFSYRYFGDKAPTLDVAELAQLAKATRFIFAVRDIRTWLCQSKIFRQKLSWQNAVPAIQAYVDLLLQASSYDHALVLRTEDLILENKDSIQKIAEYLELPDSQWMDEYWLHRLHDGDNPKAWDCHWPRGARRPTRSAAHKPMGLAVKHQLSDHPLWELVLPIFDKYYSNANQKRFSAQEIASDRKKLHKELAKHQVPLSDLYETFKSWRYLEDDEGNPVRKGIWELTKDGRLLRERYEHHPQLDIEVARRLVSEKPLPQFLMVEEEFEPVMTVTHANIFDKHAFRGAMKQAGTLIVRISHKTARDLMPELDHMLYPPLPAYFYRPSGRDQWKLLPENFSLESLLDSIESPPQDYIDEVRRKALARAADGVHTLNAVGMNYKLKKVGKKELNGQDKDQLTESALTKAELGVATLNAMGFGYELRGSRKKPRDWVARRPTKSPNNRA